jgi:C-terminal processing protease CtpA/Prc
MTLGWIQQYADTIALTTDHLAQISRELQSLDLQEGQLNSIDTLLPGISPALALHRSDDSELIRIYNVSSLGDSARELYRRWLGNYSGMALDDRTVHFTSSQPHDLVRFGVRTSQAIILYQRELPLPAPHFDLPTPTEHVEAYERELRRLDSVVNTIAQGLIPARFLTRGLLPNVQLTAVQRTYGLMSFWSEVKYNFAFFDQLPGLDWDAQLAEYLLLVQADQSNREYYRHLERLCASLRDGHTNIYPPPDVVRQEGKPSVELHPLGDQVVVTNASTDLVDSLPVGSVVTTIDDIDVLTYLRDSIYPYVAAGGDHTRRFLGVDRLLDGILATTVRLGLKLPTGELTTRTLKRRPVGEADWVHHPPRGLPASFRVLEAGIGYLALNTFSDASVVDTFMAYRSQIGDCKGLIIDLRENGGGNSDYGYAILRYFTDRPLLTPAWQSPENVAAYRAFGQYFHQRPELVDTTSDLISQSLQAYAGERWYYSRPDSIVPADTLYDLPVVVLVGTQTASSAENFLVVADPLENFTYVGEPSFGSTGQPLLINLPAGGSARICTKRNTYPDGRDYVGPGVQVDEFVQPTVEDFIDQRDVVLDRGVEILRERQ